MERIADLYFPGIIWCVNGIAIHGNGMSVMCAGSGGMDCVNFGYIDGGGVIICPSKSICISETLGIPGRQRELNHPKILQCLSDCVLFFRGTGRGLPGILRFGQIVVLSNFQSALSLNLRDIQAGNLQTGMLQNIRLDLGIGCAILKLRHIHIFQRELNPDILRVDLALGKQDNRLHMERDNGLNVHSTWEQIQWVCMREQVNIRLPLNEKLNLRL